VALEEKMNLLLKRQSHTETETIGKMYVIYENAENVFVGYTLEDTYREKKVKNQTRIPKGKYEIIKREEGAMLQRYKKAFGDDHFMLWLQNVPNFGYVYIHAGNTDADTSGCVLISTSYVKNGSKYSLVDSRPAYKRLWVMVKNVFDKGERVFITIKDEKDNDE
jgi:hypothetical protein